MEEIEFRGKRLDNGEWIYGDLCKGMGGGLCIMPKTFFGTVIFTDDEETEWNQEEDGLALGGWFSVDPKTVGQYLNLKDSQGNKVWHGDLLDFEEREWGGKFTPEPIYMEDILGDWRLAGSLSDLKEYRTVVGNVYE